MPLLCCWCRLHLYRCGYSIEYITLTRLENGGRPTEVTVVSKIKLYSKLDALEDHLKASLVPHLQIAAKGDNDLVFCVTVFNSVRELKNSTDTLTEELIEVGAQVLSLRTKLGEPSDGTIAERLCWYCRQWSGLDNGDKISSQVLAKKFLLEIENSLTV